MNHASIDCNSGLLTNSSLIFLVDLGQKMQSSSYLNEEDVLFCPLA